MWPVEAVPDSRGRDLEKGIHIHLLVVGVAVRGSFGLLTCTQDAVHVALGIVDAVSGREPKTRPYGWHLLFDWVDSTTLT